MGDWKRSSRECLFNELRPEMTAAITAHIEQYGLEVDPIEILMCVETTSETIKKAIIGGSGRAVLTSAFVTPIWLIWAIRGENPEVAVMSARLADVVVQDYAKTQFAKMVPDTGIEVSGSFTDVSERGSAFLGLDEGLVSERFKETILTTKQHIKQR